MGFGGNTTLLACKIGTLNRLPASFFVSIAYMCWAYRRRGVVLDGTSGEVIDWLYHAPGERFDRFEPGDDTLLSVGQSGSGARVVRLQSPPGAAAVRGLKA